jgi:hypothetical protein
VAVGRDILKFWIISSRFQIFLDLVPSLLVYDEAKKKESPPFCDSKHTALPHSFMQQSDASVNDWHLITLTANKISFV